MNDPIIGSCVLPVAAVDQTGTLATFSNYGLSVPIAAPGVNILSACYLPAARGTCASSTVLMSGTSQASECQEQCGSQGTFGPGFAG